MGIHKQVCVVLQISKTAWELRLCHFKSKAVLVFFNKNTQKTNELAFNLIVIKKITSQMFENNKKKENTKDFKEILENKHQKK